MHDRYIEAENKNAQIKVVAESPILVLDIPDLFIRPHTARYMVIALNKSSSLREG